MKVDDAQDKINNVNKKPESVVPLCWLKFQICRLCSSPGKWQSLPIVLLKRAASYCDFSDVFSDASTLLIVYGFCNFQPQGYKTMPKLSNIGLRFLHNKFFKSIFKPQTIQSDFYCLPCLYEILLDLLL